jgi:hypothetical protein
MTNTVSKAIRFKGSNRTAWNVANATTGAPVGQIWTFTARGEIHPFHFKTLDGFYCIFESLASAIAFAKV